MVLDMIAKTGGSLLVGRVLDDAEDAVRDILDHAFDRLDSSLLKAAEQLVWMLGETRRELEGLTDSTLDELDDQQRRVVTDLKSLAERVEKGVSGQVKELDELVTKTLSVVNGLVSDNPGFMNLTPAIAKTGDETATFKIQGVSLDNVEFAEMRLNGEEVTPEITHRDDDEITFRLPLNTAMLQHMQAEDSDGLLHLPLAFALYEKRFFGLIRRKTGRPYRTVLYVFPEIIGEVVAVFAGDVEQRETKMKTFTFKHPRAKSSWRGKRGHNPSYHSCAPDTGWLFDFNAARFKLSMSNRCSGRRSSARWTTKNAGKLDLHVTPVTESRPSVTCHITSIINVPQYKVREVHQYFETGPTPLRFGEDLAVTLPEAAMSADGVRLSHIEIRSPLLEGEGLILSPNGGEGEAGPEWGGFSLSYSEATQTAIIRANFV